MPEDLTTQEKIDLSIEYGKDFHEELISEVEYRKRLNDLKFFTPQELEDEVRRWRLGGL